MATMKNLVLLLSVLGVQANPARLGWMEEYGMVKRDTSFPADIAPSCVDFVIGSDQASSGTPSGSKVCISVDPATHTLTVTYPDSPSGYTYLKEHVWVGCSPPKGTNEDGSQAPGKYPFTTDKGQCTTTNGGASASCAFNIDTILADCKSCDKSFYIITHASLTKTVDGGTTTATGAGQGTKFDNAWHRMYWKPTFYCLCTSTITFTPSTFYYTLESTTTVTSVSTTSYTTTSTSVYVITTTSSSIYDTTEYSTTIFPSTSTTTSTSISTPPTSYSTSTCR